jgi:hypothetical protein
MSSPIDGYDDSTSVVFTFGADSFGTWLFVILAVVLFVDFLARMIQHENHAYKSVIENTPVEPGPAVEGEPQAS